MLERSGLLKFSGLDMTIVGSDIELGQSAPAFTVQTSTWQTISPLNESSGKVRIIAAVPSLDTTVCDRETRRFNLEAASLDEDIHIFVISTDLPVAQKRWCGAAGIDQVKTFSDHMNVDFGLKYGCLLKEARVLRRAVFVIDRKDRICYVDYMPATGDEPHYDAVITAAKSAL